MFTEKSSEIFMRRKKHFLLTIATIFWKFHNLDLKNLRISFIFFIKTNPFAGLTILLKREYQN